MDEKDDFDPKKEKKEKEVEKIPMERTHDQSQQPSLLPIYNPLRPPKAPPPGSSTNASTPSPQSSPPQYPGQYQPSQAPPPRYPPPYYPQQAQSPYYPPHSPPPYYQWQAQHPYYPPPQNYPSIYTWEIYPHLAREFLSPKPNKKPVLVLIGVLLLITAAILYPLAGMFIYYGSSENIDFGSDFDMQGKIIDQDGTNISGVRVIIEDTGLVALTDSQGNYDIHNVPSGIRTMRLHRTGFKDEKHIILLHEDFSPQVDFQMEQGSGELEFNNLWFFFTIAALMILFSVFVLAGSFFAFKQKRFAVVLVGGILGIITTAPTLLFMFIPSIFFLGTFGFILSTTAMIIAISNRKSFSENVHVAEDEHVNGAFGNEPTPQIPNRGPTTYQESAASGSQGGQEIINPKPR